MYPAGAATGTLDDFLMFAKALLPQDNVSSPLFKNKDTLGVLLSPTSYYSETDIARNYHGLWTLPYGSGIIGHSGNTQGCTSGLYFDSETQTGIVIMTNEVGETAYNYGLLKVVFGDYTQNFAITQSQDVSGIYRSARSTYEKGFARIFTYTSGLLPLSKTDNPEVYTLAVGQGILTQLSNNVYILDNGNGTQALMVRTVNSEGISKFETMSQDLFLENTTTFIFNILLFLFYWVAVLYAVIMLLINGIIGIVYILKKKKTKVNMQNILRITSYLCMLAAGTSTFFLLFSSGYMLYYDTALKSIISIIALLIPIIYVVRGLAKNKTKGKQKISLVFTAIMVLIMLSNVLYWQWFNFWSF